MIIPSSSSSSSSDTPSPNSNSSRLPPNAPFWPTWDTRQYMLLNETMANVSDSHVSSGDYHLGSKERCDYWAKLRTQNMW